MILSARLRILMLSVLTLLWVSIFPISFAQEAVTPTDPAAVIPQPMPMVEVESDDDIINFLIFGTATNNPNNPGLADMLMLVSVNRTANSASMLSVPRDLWVYAPGLDRMMKLTATYFEGETHKLKGGGLQLLKDTLRYNLGIEVDYYAHVNFNGFLQIINALDGITLPVDCIIEDWRLISPELDKQVAENYEMFTMPIGVHSMDSETALWYVRSRRTSSDLDRGRRQQDVMRAMWRKIRQSDALLNLPTIWEQVTQSVDTDLTLADVIGLVPFSLNIDSERITPFRFKMTTHVNNAYSPAPERQAILLPDREAVNELMLQFLTPPTTNQISRAGLRVQIVNMTGFESLAYVAADRLAQEGFVTEIVEEAGRYRNYNSIYDFTGQEKGSPLPTLQKVLRVTDDGIVVQPEPNRTVDYKIYLGDNYRFWSCTRDVIQPEWTPEPDTDTVTPTPET